MVYIYSNDDLLQKFYDLIENPQARDRLYVYRLVDGQKVKPAIYNGRPFGTLQDWLRDEHGGGDFHVMIRRGETMLLTGTIGIGEPISSNRAR